MSVLSIDLKPEGKPFQIMGPEYVMLCLKISLYSLGVINEYPDVDLSVGMFSLGTRS